MDVREVFSPTFDTARVGELRAVLRLKADNRKPSYQSIADDFDVHVDTVRRYHGLLCEEDPSFPKSGALSRQDMLMELQQRVERGEQPTDLFKQIPENELQAMIAGVTRMIFSDLATPGPKSLGSPTLLLKYVDTYRDMLGYNRTKADDTSDLDELGVEDLTKIETQAVSLIRDIREGRERRNKREFLNKYGTEVIEIEVEDVGSVGEAQGG